MANNQVFRGKASGGKLSLYKRKEFDKYLGTIEGEIDLILRKHRKPRTSGNDWEKSNQNGYYWGVVIPALVNYYHDQSVKLNKPEMALTPDQVHEGIKFLFLNEGTFTKFSKIKSTKDLNTLEWESLMQQIRDWAMEEYHLYIPEPMEN
jgi:hypothetical protein